MKNSNGENTFSDSEMDLLLKKSLQDLPRKIEQKAKEAALADQEELFTEERQNLLKEKIDLEIQRRSLEEEKERLQKKQKRFGRIKIAIATAAVAALVLFAPIPTQGGKSVINIVREGLFPSEDTVLDNTTLTGEEQEQIIMDEDEVWKKAEELLQAPRLVFPVEGDEWWFERGEVHDKSYFVRMMYRYYGEYVIVEITKELESVTLPRGLAEKTNQSEQFTIEGNRKATGNIFKIENEKGQIVNYVDINYGPVVYKMISAMEYDEFVSFVKEIKFKE